MTTDFFGANDGAQESVVQADGNIVLSGYTTNGSERQFALAGYLANGTQSAVWSGRQTDF